MTEMKLEDLKLKNPTEMLSFAEELGVENASTLRKQELMFATLKQLASKEIDITGIGVVETFAGGIEGLSTYRDGIAFGILILILLFKPAGLFAGRK